MADSRMVGHAIRRRMTGPDGGPAPTNHLQAAADAAGDWMRQRTSQGLGSTESQGVLFNAKPTTTFHIDPVNFTSRKVTDWGRPHFPEA